MVSAEWKKIKAGDIAPVYLLTGEERYILDTTIQHLKKAMPDVDESTVNYFDLSETPVEFVIDEADTLPFLQERKLIIASNATFLRAQEKGKEKIEHNLSRLESWLQTPSPTAVVVFLAPYEKLDARKKITKLMTKQTTVIEAKRLEGTDLLTWVQHEAKSNGIEMERERAQQLVDLVGDDLLLLSSELLKIATYLGGQGVVTEKILQLLVPRTPETDVFRLTDAYVNGKVSESISIYHDLLRNGEEPIMLTSLIASQIRLMIQVNSLQKKGYQQQQIAKTIGVHPYRVKLMMGKSRHTSPERLLQILDRLAMIDYQLKSTGGRRERIFELFLMQPLQNNIK